MKSKGLGDSIEKITRATGVKHMVDTISEGLNIPCGCQGRKDALNKIFPYKNNKKSLKKPNLYHCIKKIKNDNYC